MKQRLLWAAFVVLLGLSSCSPTRPGAGTGGATTAARTAGDATGSVAGPVAMVTFDFDRMVVTTYREGFSEAEMPQLLPDDGSEAQAAAAALDRTIEAWKAKGSQPMTLADGTASSRAEFLVALSGGSAQTGQMALGPGNRRVFRVTGARLLAIGGAMAATTDIGTPLFCAASLVGIVGMCLYTLGN